jgi:Type II secretion system (T2SS), protein E, N-terminal domain
LSASPDGWPVSGGLNGTTTGPTWDPSRIPLGTLIFRAGLLTEEQIQDSLREGERMGKRLGEVLVERGLLSEKEVTRFLAKQRGVDFVDLEARPADPNAVQLLRAETARRYRALVFALENGTPLVAVTDVADEMTTQAVREELQRDVRFVLAGEQDLTAAIAKAYAPPAEPLLATVPSLVPPHAEEDHAESGVEAPLASAAAPVPPVEPAPAPDAPAAAAPIPMVSHELHVVGPSSPPAEESAPMPDTTEPIEAPPVVAHGGDAAQPVPHPAVPPPVVPYPVAPPPIVPDPPVPTSVAPPPAEPAPVVMHPAEAPPPVSHPVEPPPVEAPEPAEAEAPHWGGSLGELLLESGLLTNEQLEDALREAARRGRRLGEIVLERGWVHERTLAHCLASQKGLPFVSVRDRSPEPEAVKLLPRKIAHLYGALPIELDGAVPVVAISDPTNEAALANVRAALGGEIRFMVAATSELASALDRAYDALEPAPVATAPAPAVSAPEPTADTPPEQTAEESAASGASAFHVAIRLVNSEAVTVGTFATAAEAEAEAAAVVKRLASTGPGDWPLFAGRFLRPDAIVSVDVVAEP